MYNFLIVFLGGGLGATLRYAFNVLFLSKFSYWTTFSINILGCLLIGIISVLGFHIALFMSPTAKLLIVTGFLGGFTTLSTFQLEIFFLVKDARYIEAVFYAFLTLIVSFISVSIGVIATEHFIK